MTESTGDSGGDSEGDANGDGRSTESMLEITSEKVGSTGAGAGVTESSTRLEVLDQIEVAGGLYAGLNPTKPTVEVDILQISSPTSGPKYPVDISRDSTADESAEAAPLEQAAGRELNPNPRFSHIWERSGRVGCCEVVVIQGRNQNRAGFNSLNSSLGEGFEGWSSLGGDNRSFVQVVKEFCGTTGMQGRGGFDGRRDGFGKEGSGEVVAVQKHVRVSRREKGAEEEEG